jgi:hypothetical protein
VLFGMAHGEYKRLLNFLAAHECALDFREFRGQRPEGRDSRGPMESSGGRASGSNL